MSTNLVTPKKFSMQQVFEILLQKPADKKIIAYLDDVKTSGLENTVEMTYPTGARGNVYIGGGFSHSKRAKFNITSATWNTDVMAAQNGTELIQASDTQDVNVVEYEIIDGGTSNTYKTTYDAIGATGSELGFVYVLNEDGTYGKQYKQGSTASSGNFAYSSKTITFASSDTVTGKIACVYTRKASTGAQKLEITSDGVPATVLVTAYGLAKDICSGEFYKCQVHGMAQVDGNFNMDVAADGEPASHSVNLEFVKSCTSKRLYDFIVYTDGE